VLVSSDTVDDAGVYLMEDGSAIVFTVDFFTPVVDDPRDYGRIAAANSLSDVYAMGATPTAALNIMCFPDGELPPRVMGEILLGGREKASEAGVIVLGGHSVSDRELKFGLAVVGHVDPEKLVTNAAARPGDSIVLTKPLGIGVLSTALKEGKLSEEATSGMTKIMSALNRDASRAMVEVGVSAATDITGFGLMGHATELADASGVTLRFRLQDVPLIDGALEALDSGLAPGGLFTNRHYYSRFVNEGTLSRDSRTDLMYDPQTSGGLLIAVDSGRADRLVGAIAALGTESWTVGEVIERGEHAVVLA
jgi:selenide,water dikinase